MVKCCREGAYSFNQLNVVAGTAQVPHRVALSGGHNLNSGPLMMHDLWYGNQINGAITIGSVVDTVNRYRGGASLHRFTASTRAKTRTV